MMRLIKPGIAIHENSNAARFMPSVDTTALRSVNKPPNVTTTMSQINWRVATLTASEKNKNTHMSGAGINVCCGIIVAIGLL
jgi:hypothetical protein